MFESYNGNEKSALELEINSLQEKLNKEDYNKLVNGFENYKNYIFCMLARTKRVYIRLSDKEREHNDFSDIEKLFEGLDEEI